MGLIFEKLCSWLPNTMLWCDESKQVLANLERSREFRSHLRDHDLHAIPKRSAGISQVVLNISSDTAASFLGYSTGVLSKCVNGVTALLLVKYVEQRVNFLPKPVPDASLYWPSSAFRRTASRKKTS